MDDRTPTPLRTLSGWRRSLQATTSINGLKTIWRALAPLAGTPRTEVKSMLRKLLACALLTGCFSVLWAQKRGVVDWTMVPDPASAAPGKAFRLKLTAKVDPEWHMYSLTTPKGGGLPAVIKLAENPAVSGVKGFQPKPESKFDPNFGVNTGRYEGEVVFFIEGQLAKDSAPGPLELTARIRYSPCTDKVCNPPS